MTERSLRLDQLGPAMRELLAQKEKEVIRATRNAARRGESHVRALSMESPPSDQGTYAAGWTVQDEENGATLLNDAPHASIVEEGSRPHWPPFFPILAYVGRKRGVSTDNVAMSSAQYDLSDQKIFKDEPALETVRLISLGVCRKIAAKGTPARHIMRDSLPHIERFLQEEIDRVLAEGNN